MIIKDLRESKGWSQSDLARAADLNLSVIQKWEQGITSLAASTSENVKRVAVALETTVEELLESEEK